MKEISFSQMTKLTSPNPLTLVCTKKEDGTTNLSTISWWMPLSFKANLFALAINQRSHGGERLRETGRAVIAIPAVGCESYILNCGAVNGDKVNKAEKFGIELKELEGTDIRVPAHCTAALVGRLVRYEEAGDHKLYIMEVEKVFGDEAETPLFAWKGYAEANTAVRGTPAS